MPSTPINFRIPENVYLGLIREARPGETPSLVAQRLLTKLLTGSEERVMGAGGRPPELSNIIIRK